MKTDNVIKDTWRKKLVIIFSIIGSILLSAIGS